MAKIKYTKEILEPIINSSLSYKEVFNKLGMTPGNGSHSVINKAIKRYNLSIKHFKNISWTKPRKLNNCDIFKKDSDVDRSTVRKKIIKHGLLPYKCQYCGCDDNWIGKKMPLILDHINGINNDNRLENLRFLCSNCDSIQDTYKSKNKNSDLKQKLIKKQLNKQIEQIEKRRFKEEKQNLFIYKIKESDVDFSKTGWRLEIAKKLLVTPQWAGKFVKKHIPEIWNICFKHKDRK